VRLWPRLFGAVSGVTALTLGGAFFAVYQANNRAQERQLDDALLHEAREEAAEVASVGGGDELVISAREGPYANDVGPLTKYAVVYDARGKPLAATPSFQGRAPRRSALPPHGLSAPFDARFDGEHLRGVVVEVPSGEGHLLWLAAPRTDLDGDAAFLARAMLGVFALALCWSVLLVYGLVRRFVAVNQSVARVIERVAAGDLSARVPEDPHEDELGALGRDVNQVVERLSSLLAAQRLFIAYAAHELRSPLTSLYGELAHALRRERDAESYRHAISEALESAVSLKQLAEDLLTFARSAESLAEPREPVSLDAAVERARRWLAAQISLRRVELRIVGPLGEAQGRAADVERLLRNLLENAVLHAPEGGAVTVSAEPGLDLTLRIHNHGSPLADAELERMFEPFVRGADSAARGIPGSGLGLAIARQLARAHGGSVWLEPGRDSGVCALVRLPRPPASPR
jgi:two-component system, OmpR family, sensor kinase